MEKWLLHEQILTIHSTEVLAGCCLEVIQSNKKRGSARQYHLLDTNGNELKSLAPDSMQSSYQLNPLSAVDVAENWQQYRVASFDRAVEVANISATDKQN